MKWRYEIAGEKQSLAGRSIQRIGAANTKCNGPKRSAGEEPAGDVYIDKRFFSNFVCLCSSDIFTLPLGGGGKDP